MIKYITYFAQRIVVLGLCSALALWKHHNLHAKKDQIQIKFKKIQINSKIQKLSKKIDRLGFYINLARKTRLNGVKTRENETLED